LKGLPQFVAVKQCCRFFSRDTVTSITDYNLCTDYGEAGRHSASIWFEGTQWRWSLQLTWSIGFVRRLYFSTVMCLPYFYQQT